MQRATAHLSPRRQAAREGVKGVPTADSEAAQERRACGIQLYPLMGLCRRRAGRAEKRKAVPGDAGIPLYGLHPFFSPEGTI